MEPEINKKQLHFATKIYTIAEILDWKQRKLIFIDPDFQRRDVWSPDARSYFLDTILKNYPTHKIFIREYIRNSKYVREIIDGQQRIDSILFFLNGDLKLLGKYNPEFANRSFDELPLSKKADFLNYNLTVEVLYNATDLDVLELFARLNTYTVRLNSQELRNAQYHGEFKRVIYDIANKSIEFYSQYGIISKRKIMRMEEAEFISELFIAMMDGFQDKKKTIDIYYKKYDKKYDDADKYIDRYWKIIDIIKTYCGTALKSTVFKRKIMFYTLFLTLYDILYSLPNQEKKEKKDYSLENLSTILLDITSIINEKDVRTYSQFLEACSRQTDNIGPRQIRHTFLLNKLSKKGD